MITANIGSKTFRFPEALEEYFQPFRSHVIGLNQEFDSPYGKKKIIYADWTASGRLYQPIEKNIRGFWTLYGEYPYRVEYNQFNDDWAIQAVKNNY